MFLTEPEETQFDLRWRMFGIDVRVHPLFWVISIVMGWSAMEQGVAYLLLWIGCGFISILIHELGHMVMGMLFGSSGYIVLYGMGGLAVGSRQLGKRWQRIAVSFAGPLAGFLFLGAIYVALLVVSPERAEAVYFWVARLLGMNVTISEAAGAFTRENSLVVDGLRNLTFINLIWGLVNLLPVYPLDGGQISRDVCLGLSPRAGVKISLGISLLTAGLVCVNALVNASRGKPLIPYLPAGGRYVALLFGILAFGNFQEFQRTGPTSREPERGQAPWERDPDYWKK